MAPPRSAPARGAPPRGPAGEAAATSQSSQARPAASRPGFSSLEDSIFSPYHVQGRIGEGTYGVVYVATPRRKGAATPSETAALPVAAPHTCTCAQGAQLPNRKLALKLLKPTKEYDGVSPTAVREVALLRELDHPHVARLEAVHVDVADHVLCMVFEYCEFDLYELVRHHRERLNKAAMCTYQVKSLVWQLLNGLEYLHSQWVIHRDLKPSNVLVTSESAAGGGGVVKIADFGLARIFQAPLRPLHDNGVVVTIWYRAPELLLGSRHYTPALDVWAVGCIFAELTALRPLFQGEEVKRSGSPFQKDQILKICELLGAPTEAQWPALRHLPHWLADDEGIVGATSEAAQAASRKRRRDDSSAPPALATPNEPSPLLADAAIIPRGSAAHRLLAAMLAFDPMQRLSAQSALSDPYFTTLDPRPGRNALRPPDADAHSRVAYPSRRVMDERGTQPPPPPPR